MRAREVGIHRDEVRLVPGVVEARHGAREQSIGILDAYFLDDERLAVARDSPPADLRGDRRRGTGDDIEAVDDTGLRDDREAGALRSARERSVVFAAGEELQAFRRGDGGRVRIERDGGSGGDLVELHPHEAEALGVVLVRGRSARPSTELRVMGLLHAQPRQRLALRHLAARGHREACGGERERDPRRARRHRISSSSFAMRSRSSKR